MWYLINFLNTFKLLFSMNQETENRALILEIRILQEEVC